MSEGMMMNIILPIFVDLETVVGRFRAHQPFLDVRYHPPMIPVSLLELCDHVTFFGQ